MWAAADSSIHFKMPQLSDFPRAVIVLFQTENSTWGLKRCQEILPNFFGEITQHQFSTVAASLKIHGAVAAEKRKPGTGTVTRIDSPIKEAVLDLSMSPVDKSRRHSSQREISRELGISKWSVYHIKKQVGLKCYRGI